MNFNSQQKKKNFIAEDNNLSLQGNYVQNQPTAEEIEDWLIDYLAELLEIEPTSIKLTIPLKRQGVDSAGAAILTGELADWLGIKLEPTIILDYPTISALAEHLSKSVQED